VGMSFGQGMALSYSWKQTINTKSSTEAELVGVDNSLGFNILWARYFMQEQGYYMDLLLLHQDNMSAILLETNRRTNSSTWTKHIKIEYFIIKKVDREEITIKHFLTNQMLTDINTKIKLGTVFRVFRGHVMGIPKDYNDDSFATRCNFRPPNLEPAPVSMLPIPKDRVAMHECVGDNVKGPRLANARPSEKVGIDANVEVRAEPAKQNQQAPIKMMSGRAWSMGIYQAKTAG